jgi:uncharacterized protein (TIGR02145 family)
MFMIRQEIKVIAIILICAGLSGCKTHFVKDIEGNSYKTVMIGTQEWMAENLRTTKYNDGTEIPIVIENDSWAKLTSPAVAWYNNDAIEFGKTYGALYNWYAVTTNKLCPIGWHVSSDADWTTLSFDLEGGTKVGGKLKETGIEHWKSPNTEATNESQFTALPGGYRTFEGAFNYISVSGYWWTSTEYNESSVLFYNLRYKFGNIYKYRSERNCGFSVRCVRDTVKK